MHLTEEMKQALVSRAPRKSGTHQYPPYDIIEHDLNTLDCVCGPNVDFSFSPPFVKHFPLGWE